MILTIDVIGFDPDDWFWFWRVDLIIMIGLDPGIWFILVIDFDPYNCFDPCDGLWSWYFVHSGMSFDPKDWFVPDDWFWSRWFALVQAIGFDHEPVFILIIGFDPDGWIWSLIGLSWRLVLIMTIGFDPADLRWSWWLDLIFDWFIMKPVKKLWSHWLTWILPVFYHKGFDPSDWLWSWLVYHKSFDPDDWLWSWCILS